MDGWTDWAIRLSPILVGVAVPLVVRALDARVQARSAFLNREAEQEQRLDARVEAYVARLEGDNARCQARCTDLERRVALTDGYVEILVNALRVAGLSIPPRAAS